jgi:predicted dehydrogenase
VVLGASHWHAPLYRAGLARRFRVTAVQDPDPAVARAFAEPLGAPVAASVDEALDQDGIDVAFVFCPHHEMLAVGRKLIGRGIPFVIEKPAGANLDDLRAIEEEARSAAVPATVASSAVHRSTRGCDRPATSSTNGWRSSPVRPRGTGATATRGCSNPTARAAAA